jgi:hypothetical protein
VKVPAKRTTPPPIYQLKITLQEIRPPIWRRIQVPARIHLCCLHDVFQLVIGWTNSHLHSFEKDGKSYGMPDPDDFDELQILDEGSFTLDHLLKSEGDSLEYVYDFGDGWRHEVVLEKISAGESAWDQPVCLGGERHCPPEDVGGPPGYERFLEAIFDPKHEEHESYVRWVGERFQPEEFDMAAVNRALKRIRWPARHRRHPI